MLRQFLTFIENQNLFSIKDRMLLAHSGGKDSVALADLLLKAGFDFGIAHCNFGLRGADSDGDQEFVKDFCKKNNLEFHTIKFKTKSFAKENGISTQMAAREMRYKWFSEILEEEKYDFLLTAHHLDDRIETLLLNITKGTGPKGLQSIPIKTEKIRRPMMFIGVEEILNYLKTNHLEWREDISNTSTDYQRNKIRHHILPELKEINPGLHETQLVNLKRFESLNEIIEEKLQEFKNEITETAGIFNIPFENWKNKAGFKLILEEFLKPYGFNFHQIEEIFGFKQSGKVINTEFFQLTKSGDQLFLSKKKELNLSEELIIPNPGKYFFENLEIEISLIETAENPDFKNPDIAYFDAEKLIFPLKIRKWQQGDKMFPFGMKGTKLVSDILIDKKVNILEKQNTKVLISDTQIAWVLGLKTSDIFKLKMPYNKIFKIIINFI
ncbi:MAG: tRNA lysidine(34) synthetase TilS [Cytophagaceae bacterium]|nr:tRNA lysidine(34) synthetase TilS [Cytophagaceae bacterium]MBL0303197.1 tRNA lysidine(34) synthetase TilS [Cytophagaceae bacterium]MBL0326048.1 tRNA lysidine(34) synthetase TilS [Cytophagaceae bacterium]